MRKTFKADKDELYNVLGFVEEEIGDKIGMKQLMSINVVVEELFVNVASYAYQRGKDESKGEDSEGTGFVDIDIKNDEDNQRIIITFEDSGIPFDPLEKSDPDITLNAEEREIGGLGIFIVKKMMDKVDYNYINGRNTLIIEKKY